MVRKVVTALILLPLAIVIVLFAVANRTGVVVSFDPFSSEAPALAMTLPLYLIILVVLITGVIIGGAAAWARQAKWRRAARHAERDARRLREEANALQRRLDAGEAAPPAASIASIAYRRPPAA